jgi:hypothetical protein
MADTTRTPFAFGSTADEILEGVDPSGQRAMATGAGSGIGIETAHALAKAGAEDVLAVRPTRSDRNGSGFSGQ